MAAIVLLAAAVVGYISLDIMLDGRLSGGTEEEQQ